MIGLSSGRPAATRTALDRPLESEENRGDRIGLITSAPLETQRREKL
jgi:hypothetical protein